MRISLVSGIAALVVLASASPIIDNHVLHEKRDAAPKQWVKRARIQGEQMLPMRIGLVQQNLDRGHDFLMEISDPDSPKYGKHYTQEEIVELFAPAKQAVDSTIDWLKSVGISAERIGHSVNKQWIQFDAKAEEAERLFKTKYYAWEHRATGKKHVACDEYHVPEHIKHHIDYITPGLKLLVGGKSPAEKKSKGHQLKKRKTPGGIVPIINQLGTTITGLTDPELLKLCDTAITPPCIAALYKIPKGTKAHPHNKMGIFEEGDFYAPEDLIEFFAALAPYIPATTKPVLKGVDGGKAPGLVATGESDLDFQITYPILYPQNSVLYQTDDVFYSNGIGTSSAGFLNTFFDALDGSYCTSTAFGETGNSDIDPKYPDPNPLGYQGKLQCGVYKPTHVISISYGEQEDDLPTNYQRRQCAEMMKLGMQGTTIILASGDSGVAARSTDDGNSNGCLGKNGTVFNPDFPASCPYVTALGSVFLPKGANVHKDAEVATTSFPSGGGFSNIYGRPSYQNSQVSAYFAKHDPGYPFYSTVHTNNPSDAVTQGRQYNRIGRGYPDAAAIGDNVVIFLDGTPMLIGGTSAAAPTFGAIINRINEERLSAGKSTVGFVNPTMYKNPGMFHDITTGTNAGCGTNGFSAVSGWDPVSGLGSPNYPAMLKVFMKLP